MFFHGPTVADQLGLEKQAERLGEGLTVVGVPARADRAHRAGLGEALGVANSQVLPGLNRSSV